MKCAQRFSKCWDAKVEKGKTGLIFDRVTYVMESLATLHDGGAINTYVHSFCKRHCSLLKWPCLLTEYNVSDLHMGILYKRPQAKAWQVFARKWIFSSFVDSTQNVIQIYFVRILCFMLYYVSGNFWVSALC